MNIQLSRKQILAAKALARGKTRAESAAEAEVSLRTIFDWQLKPEFAEAVEQMRAEFWESCLTGLRREALDASRYLGRVVREEAAPDRGRIQAASVLLSAAFNLLRWREVEEIKGRLDRLEIGLNGCGTAPTSTGKNFSTGEQR